MTVSSQQKQASDKPQILDSLYFSHFQNRITDEIVTYLKLAMFDIRLTNNP